MLSVGQFSPSSVYRSLVLTRARIHAHAIRARRWDRKPKHRSDKDEYERAPGSAATVSGLITFRLRSVLAVPQSCRVRPGGHRPAASGSGSRSQATTRAGTRGQPHARAREMGRRFGECGFDIRHVSVWRFVKIRHDSYTAFGAPCTFIPKSSHEHQHSLQVSPALGPKSGAASSRARRPPVPRRAHRTAREAATMPWSEGKLSVGKTISLT